MREAAGREQTSQWGDEGTGSGAALPVLPLRPTILWLCDHGQVNLSELELPSLFIKMALIMPHKRTGRVNEVLGVSM